MIILLLPTWSTRGALHTKHEITVDIGIYFTADSGRYFM